MDAMPFEIDLKQRMRLTDQLADGFRRAILTGVTSAARPAFFIF